MPKVPDDFDLDDSLENEFPKLRQFTPSDDVRPLVANLVAKRNALRGMPMDFAEETQLLWLETDGFKVGPLIRAYLETDAEYIDMVQRDTLRALGAEPADDEEHEGGDDA